MTWRLASCTYRLPGPAITSTRGDRLGAVGERGDRLRAAHRVDLVDAAQRARGQDRRVRAPGAQTTTSSTPAARAVTTPMTTVRRIRAAPAGHVDRGAPHGHLADAHGLTLGSATSAFVVAPGLGDRAHVGDRDLEARADVGVELRQRPSAPGARRARGP